MDNKTAIGLGLAILAALLADYLWFDMAYSIFAVRKFLALIGWLMFWR